MHGFRFVSSRLAVGVRSFELAKINCASPIGGAILIAAGVAACTLSEGHDEAAFNGDGGASGSDSGAEGCAGGDCCPNDPRKRLPGVCGCGVPDEDTAAAASCVALTAALAHRYSFDGEGQAVEDSVGGANGLVLGTTLNGDGTLVLAGGTSEQYVDLPNGIISTLQDATFEVWFTWADGDPWQRIFDFGTSGVEDMQGTGSSYLFLTPRTATDPPRMRVTFSSHGLEGEMVVDTSPPVPDILTLVTVVVDDSHDSISLYVDGALEATSRFDGNLAQITDVNNWIGRSLFLSDPELAATLTEFRIYRAALSASHVALSYRYGPDAAFFSPPAQASDRARVAAANGGDESVGR